MNGKMKKIKDSESNYIYPITVAEGVFIDSNKTLKQAIDDGSIGGSGGTTEVSVSGRSYAIFSLRGAIINVRRETDIPNEKRLYYTFPDLDTNRYRRLFVWTGAGANKTIDIPDGVLNDNDALVYDISANTLTIKNGAWGGVTTSQNEFLLLYNNLANIGGILSKYCSMGGDSLSVPVKEVEAELISNSGSTQGIFIIGSEIFKCVHSNDEHIDFANISVVTKENPNTVVRTISHNLGHLNAPSYSQIKNALIVGNGSKSFTLQPKGWIIPNFSTVANGATIDFNTVDKIELDFTQFTTEWKGQLCWGYDSTDIVYLMTNDNQILRKVKLGKGSENLGSGVFIEGTSVDRYNGSYAILNTLYSRVRDTMGGMFFYKGCIYTGVKGENNIRKCTPLTNGYFNTKYISLVSSTGDMQGITIDSGLVYAFTDYKGYKFNISEL
jgi:hypothetical protein